ncbi:hypothetical protein [Beijerinckia sp. L45]|uniref:hypothetical protein n=1 Tax=Beijerinckia sp. L45 TaxID=1641855 RepID=UPI001576680C|nr:hypothetical protein [Beijerinckia sp. L45]
MSNITDDFDDTSALSIINEFGSYGFMVIGQLYVYGERKSYPIKNIKEFNRIHHLEGALAFVYLSKSGFEREVIKRLADGHDMTLACNVGWIEFGGGNPVPMRAELGRRMSDRLASGEFVTLTPKTAPALELAWSAAPPNYLNKGLHLKIMFLMILSKIFRQHLRIRAFKKHETAVASGIEVRRKNNVFVPGKLRRF